MRPAEQALLIEQVGAFVADRIKAATLPLEAHIANLEAKILALQNVNLEATVQEIVAKEIDGAEKPPAPMVDLSEITDAVQVLREKIENIPQPLPVEVDWEKVSGIVHEEITNLKIDLEEHCASVVADIPKPENGKDADPEVVQLMVNEAVSQIPKPEDGKDADPEVIKQLVAEAVAEITVPKEVTLEQIEELVTQAVGNIPEAKPGAPGKDADPEAVRGIAEEFVAQAVAKLEIPQPKDGKTPTAEEVRDVVEEVVAAHIALIPKAKDGKDGKDGIGMAGAVIDRDGALVLTFTDGTAKTLGIVVGKDADPQKILDAIRAEVAKFPIPKDGMDGLGFDDMTVEHDGDRTLTLKFQRGDRIKEFPIVFPVTLSRGVWRDGEFVKGDGVIYDGSYWVAQRDTKAKPGTSDDWKLSAKRGNAGMSAYDIARRAGFKGTEKEWVKSLKGDKGDPGEKGKDLTRMTADGKKY